MESNDFFKRLRRCRMSAGLQGKDLAMRAGISGPYLTQLEKNQRLPSRDLLNRLADALQVDANWLLNGDHSDRVRLVPRSEAVPDQLADRVGENLYCYPPEDRDRLATENADLRRRLDEAMAIIRDQAAALAAAGRAGVAPAAPACGANSGSTVKKGRAEA